MISKSFTGLVLSAALIFSLQSCNKGNKCPEPGYIMLASLNTVYLGGTINLKSVTSEGYTYKYTGPGGFVKEFGHTNYSGDVMITNATTAMSGTYTIEEKNDDGCVVSRGTVDIPVLPIPDAPCSPANNTSTSTVAGIGDYTFSSVSFSGSANVYIISAREGTGGGSALMRFAFMGTDLPKEGIYKTDPTYFATEEGRVGIFIQSGVYDFGARPFQDVYVKKVSGKLQITYCQLNFNNPVSSTAIKISCRVTQP